MAQVWGSADEKSMPDDLEEQALAFEKGAKRHRTQKGYEKSGRLFGAAAKTYMKRGCDAKASEMREGAALGYDFAARKHERQNNLGAAAELYIKAAMNHKFSKAPKLAALLYCDAARCYELLDDKDKAIEMFENAARIYESEGDIALAARTRRRKPR